MNINLDVKPNYLNISINNNGSQTLRVWEFGNSWGWNILSLIIKKPDSREQYILTRLKTIGWTVNAPTFVSIEPNNKFETLLYQGSKWWEFDQDLSALKNQPFMVKAVLEIPETPEAKEFGIFVGRVESEWVQSEPPHNWLFQED
jgi:hypothetical protein